MNNELNKGLPEVLRIVLFSRDFNNLSKEDKLEAIHNALGSNKEEMYIARYDRNFNAIRKIKEENTILENLALSIKNS